jgi:hypothetical protein
LSRDGSLAPIVDSLQALRGVNLIIAVTFVTEIGRSLFRRRQTVFGRF